VEPVSAWIVVDLRKTGVDGGRRISFDFVVRRLAVPSDRRHVDARLVSPARLLSLRHGWLGCSAVSCWLVGGWRQICALSNGCVPLTARRFAEAADCHAPSESPLRHQLVQ
jgi:hypothetical protein